MTSTEAKLKERVKELTCLYEVTSIIVNANYDHIEDSLQQIVYCLKRGWQFEDETEAQIKSTGYKVSTEYYDNARVLLEYELVIGRNSDLYSGAFFVIGDIVLWFLRY